MKKNKVLEMLEIQKQIRNDLKGTKWEDLQRFFGKKYHNYLKKTKNKIRKEKEKMIQEFLENDDVVYKYLIEKGKNENVQCNKKFH